MSEKLLNMVERFLERNIPTNEFVDAYIDAWRSERDSNEILKDDPVLSEKLSTFFCLVDMYNPDVDREDYEFDEEELRSRIQKVFDGDLTP